MSPQKKLKPFMAQSLIYIALIALIFEMVRKRGG
jgi:hypothetical protein